MFLGSHLGDIETFQFVLLLLCRNPELKTLETRSALNTRSCCVGLTCCTSSIEPEIITNLTHTIVCTGSQRGIPLRPKGAFVFGM